MHYQWQNHYQGFNGIKPLHSWQQERGCPIPRPRSFSLSSISSQANDLMEVSTRKTIIPSATVLPLDTKDKFINYESAYSKRKSFRTTNITCWLSILCLTVLVLGVVFISTVRMRTRKIPPPHVPSLNLAPNYVEQQHPYSQLPQQIPSQNAYRPFNPPAPQLSRSSLHPVSHLHHITPQHPSTQQHQPPSMQYQYLPQNHYPPEMGHVYHYSQHNIHQNVHSYPPVIPTAQHHPNHPNIHHNFQGYQWPNQQEYRANIEPTFHTPRVAEHAHVNNLPHKDHRHSSPVTSPPTRQEERAQARNDARNAHAKNKSKSLPNDDIWEEELLSINKTITPTVLKLRLQPAMFSFKEFFENNDGTLFITSHEDDEEVTIEIVEEE